MARNPNTPEDSPLTEDHLQLILQGKDMLSQARREIDKAIRAGIGVEEQRRQVQELETQLVKIHNTYFPGRTK